MTPQEMFARDIDRLETLISEMRSAVLDAQLGQGKVDGLQSMMQQFIARQEAAQERNDKSMVRLHERLDELNSKLTQEVTNMKEEVRRAQEDHRGSVAHQIQTSIIAVTNQTSEMRKELTTLHTETEGWINRAKGAWWAASILWGLFGAGVLAAVAWVFSKVNNLNEALIQIQAHLGK